MLRKRDKTTHHDPQQIDTLIGVHSVITGELSFEGAVRIDGQFKGNIHANKDGTLIVSEGALIQGEVHVPSLILHGTIEGNVCASNSLKIGSTGHLNGDVQYKTLSLAEGSAINGHCSHINKTAKEPVKISKSKTSPRLHENSRLQEV